jgi:CelD/BcsL family acetyltransferase involved in cellulose biosynthesis
MPGGMLLRLPEVRIEGEFFRSFQAALYRERANYVIESIWHRAFFRPAADAEAYESASSSGRHRRVRRLERRLGERGRLTYDEFAPGADPRGWLEAFMNLEIAGWKGRHGTAVASQARHREWLLEIGSEAAARNRLMMLALRLDGEAIALKLNFLAADGGYTLKTAYDERLEKFSPGVLLELENIRRMHARNGLAWMDSLAPPGHPMAERVWAERAAFASVVVAPGRVLGRTLLALKPMAALLRNLRSPGTR